MPLSGIKIVELTDFVAGPLAGSILSDWGAEVIKLEKLEGGDSFRARAASDPFGAMSEGDDYRNVLFEGVNYNKKSVCLDLRKEDGKIIAYKLIKSADVFLTNTRSETLKKLGMDYETLSRVAPRLIYALVTGYGTKGPDSDKPAFDQAAYWSRGGIMSLLGEPDEVPPASRGSFGDRPAALSLAFGIVLGLLHRQQTGIGEKVETSLLEMGVYVNGCDINEALHMGRDVPRLSRKTKRNPCFNVYKTKDQRWLSLAMLQSDHYWPGLCRSLGLEELIDDPRFDTHLKRCQVGNNVELILILDNAIGSKTLAELASSFNQAGIIWSPCSLVTEVINDPQVLQNEYIRDMKSDDPIKVATNPINLSGVPKRDMGPAPELGQDTQEILLELGYSRDQILSLKEHQTIL